MQQILEPAPEDVVDFFQSAKRKNHTIIVFTTCEGEYRGRGGKDLDAGRRVIRLQPDGTVAVNSEENRQPSVWQPSGSNYEVVIRDGNPWIESYRVDPQTGKPEDLVLCLGEVQMIASTRLTDDSDLEVMGSEDDVVEQIQESPELIEDGFRVLDIEFQTDAGPVDVYGKLDNGEIVFVEAKRGVVTPHNVMQIRRYIDAFEDTEGDVTVHGYLAGPDISDRAANVLEREGFHFRTIEPRVEPKQQSTKLTDYTQEG